MGGKKKMIVFYNKYNQQTRDDLLKKAKHNKIEVELNKKKNTNSVKIQSVWRSKFVRKELYNEGITTFRFFSNSCKIYSINI